MDRPKPAPADAPMADAMCSAVRPLARRLRKKLRKARDGDPDAVHDARTACRRLREALALMGQTVFVARRTAKLEQGIHRIERALGPTRDDDVFLADLDGWIGGSPPEVAKDVAALHEHLRKCRARHAHALARELGHPRHERALSRLFDWLDHPDVVRSPPASGPKRERRLVGHFVHDQCWRAYEDALAYEQRGSADVEFVHEFRSACRRLRFALELCSGALTDGASVVSPLEELQDHLGKLHDDATAVARIERWLDASRLPSTAAIRAYAADRRRARERLRAEYPDERRVLGGRAFRAALFRALNGSSPGAGPKAPRLVPAPSATADDPRNLERGIHR